MKTLLAGAGIFLFLQGLFLADGATLFKVPILVVTPTVLDFPVATTNGTATNTFLVENAGGGKLVGKATVARPFKIVDGGNYTLRENETQVVTIVYTCKSAGTNVQTVTFTGAAGAKATVVGRTKNR